MFLSKEFPAYNFYGGKVGVRNARMSIMRKLALLLAAALVIAAPLSAAVPTLTYAAGKVKKAGKRIVLAKRIVTQEAPRWSLNAYSRFSVRQERRMASSTAVRIGPRESSKSLNCCQRRACTGKSRERARAARAHADLLKTGIRCETWHATSSSDLFAASAPGPNDLSKTAGKRQECTLSS
jgi:hypothetical protein